MIYLDMAPEVSKFMPYDHKADIFSVAMIGFEMLWGEHHLSQRDGKFGSPIFGMY